MPDSGKTASGLRGYRLNHLFYDIPITFMPNSFSLIHVIANYGLYFLLFYYYYILLYFPVLLFSYFLFPSSAIYAIILAKCVVSINVVIANLTFYPNWK